MSRTPWKDFLQKKEVQEMLKKGVETRDPSLDPARVEERAREKRKEFAQAFGLHARITDVDVSPRGDVRVDVAFDEDIAFDPDDLKALEINGVHLAGAQLVEIRRGAPGGPKVQAVISVNVPKSAIAALKSLPLTVAATTKDDVRVEAFKSA